MLSRQGTNWRTKFVCVSLHLAILLSFATAARASTIYTYTGSPFTFFQGIPPAGVTHISGSFTLAAPLPANLALTNLYTSGMAPLNISFTDGLNPFTSPDINLDFQVGTDASGNINLWEINLGHNIGGLSMLIQKVTSFFTGDDSRQENIPGVNNLWYAGTVHAGTWGAPTSDGGGVTAVPEPASLVLVLSGLIGSAGSMRRRRLSH